MGNGSNKITVCPNCGLVLQGPEFLVSVNNMTQQIGLDYDPIAGRFLCGNCNYSGYPISMLEKDYDISVFMN